MELHRDGIDIPNFDGARTRNECSTYYWMRRGLKKRDEWIIFFKEELWSEEVLMDVLGRPGIHRQRQHICWI